MKYILDNDMHIHSKLSSCSNDPEQSNERILEYAKENGLKTVCVTNHFWDETVPGASPWYEVQNYPHLCEAKPLPQADGIRFLFGCETELDKNLTLGISKERLELFDFIIIPTTHLHMVDFTLTEEEAKTPESRAKVWIKRLEYILSLDLPFHKIGIAHLACISIAPKREDYLKALSLIPDTELERLLTKAAKLGVGIELNSCDMEFADDEADIVLRPFRIAKKCGCKFYCGSDAHHPDRLEKAKKLFERAIDLLELEESDKFIL